jgi:hypothetical protein
MGNNIFCEKVYENCLKFDRILDDENQVYIGISSSDKYKNVQVIRIGDSNNYNRLINFTEKENKLRYDFENNVTLILRKNESNIHMKLFDLNNNKIISKRIESTIIKNFKPINFESSELDKIYNLLNIR